jgi:hypothetical protein
MVVRGLSKVQLLALPVEEQAAASAELGGLRLNSVIAGARADILALIEHSQHVVDAAPPPEPLVQRGWAISRLMGKDSADVCMICIKGSLCVVVLHRAPGGSDWAPHDRKSHEAHGIKWHKGYYAHYDRLHELLRKKLKHMSPRPSCVLVAGHSLGAAMASICAYRLCRESALPKGWGLKDFDNHVDNLVMAYLLSPPVVVADAASRDAVHDLVGVDNIVRQHHQYDPVARVAAVGECVPYALKCINDLALGHLVSQDPDEDAYLALQQSAFFKSSSWDKLQALVPVITRFHYGSASGRNFVAAAAAAVPLILRADEPHEVRASKQTSKQSSKQASNHNYF